MITVLTQGAIYYNLYTDEGNQKVYRCDGQRTLIKPLCKWMNSLFLTIPWHVYLKEKSITRFGPTGEIPRGLSWWKLLYFSRGNLPRFPMTYVWLFSPNLNQTQVQFLTVWSWTIFTRKLEFTNRSFADLMKRRSNNFKSKGESPCLSNGYYRLIGSAFFAVHALCRLWTTGSLPKSVQTKIH